MTTPLLDVDARRFGNRATIRSSRLISIGIVLFLDRALTMMSDRLSRRAGGSIRCEH
ncbi:MAG: hypothetical protein ACRDTZ_18500 [Pseudonocardiaceae bacterium]